MGQLLSNFNQVAFEKQCNAVSLECQLIEEPWQSPSDRVHRVEMIHQLIQLLDLKLQKTIPRKQLTDIARLLELALYRRGNSLNEYVTGNTLEKRLEYLALVGYPCNTKENSIVGSKRCRENVNVHADVWTKKQKMEPKVPFLLNDQMDVVANIVQFLNGTEAIRLTAINHAARKVLPKYIRDLAITPSQLTLAYQISPHGGILSELTELRTLLISTHVDQDRMDLSRQDRNFHTPIFTSKGNHSNYCSSNAHAESSIIQLAKSFHHYQKLETLSIVSVFFNSIRHNGVQAIVDSFLSKSCPNLKSLSLAGNGIGDTGTIAISTLIAKNVCPNLSHLDLRNNYIGEKGIVFLSKSIQSISQLPHLQDLCLGGNIITSIACTHLSKSMPHIPNLEYLGLDSNYIDATGVISLVNVFLTTAPQHLKQIHLGLNAIPKPGILALLSLLSLKKSALQYIDAGQVSIASAILLMNTLVDLPTCAHVQYTLLNSIDDFVNSIVHLRSLFVSFVTNIQLALTNSNSMVFRNLFNLRFSMKTQLRNFNSAHNTIFRPQTSSGVQLRCSSAMSRMMSTTVNVPSMGDSISEGTIVEILKQPGEHAKADETVVIIETDKVSIDVNAPHSGKIEEIITSLEDVVQVGSPVFRIDESEETSESASSSNAHKSAQPEEKHLNEKSVKEERKPEKTNASEKTSDLTNKSESENTSMSKNDSKSHRTETRVKMDTMRVRTAERMKDAQNTAAMLTTFQECDVGALLDMRNLYQASFEKKHGAPLGLMSAFVTAATKALQDVPAVNGSIDENTKEIVYHEFVDISVAVASSNGIVLPVLRNTESMSFANIEKSIVQLAEKAEQNTLAIEDMAGGTFTISNGGVYGSLLSTPLLNPPQSAALGIHGIKMKPMDVDGKIVPRPIMYLALSYDHRIIDGKEAVTFLKSIADKIADPHRLLLDL